MKVSSNKNILLLLLLPIVAAAGETKAASVPLTKDTFEEVTRDKTVFIKFYAPWCGHCQELAPIWEKLAADWMDHPQALVAEVDCTRDSQAEKWCSDDFGINGFPTLLYGETSSWGSFLQRYDGERTYDTLSDFANRTLTEPFCSPGNLDACTLVKQREIGIMLKMNLKQLNSAIRLKEEGIKKREEQFQREADYLQGIHNKVALNYEIKKARVYREIKLLKEIRELRHQQCSVEDPDDSCRPNATKNGEAGVDKEEAVVGTADTTAAESV